MSVVSNQIAAALNGTGIVQVVKQNVDEYEYSYLCRVHEPEPMQKWIDFVTAVLRAEARADWDVWIAKRFFLKDGRLVFGWVIILSADIIETAGEEFKGVVQSVSAEQGLHFEIEEMPLPHVTKRDRNAPNARGKGVGPVASMPGDRMGSKS